MIASGERRLSGRKAIVECTDVSPKRLESNMPLLDLAPRVDFSLCLFVFFSSARAMCLASPLEMRDDNISRSGQSQEPKTLVDAHAICLAAPIVSSLQIFVDLSRARSLTR
jgi:hypothetical protein